MASGCKTSKTVIYTTSEKDFAYKMKMEAMKQQVKRTKTPDSKEKLSDTHLNC